MNKTKLIAVLYLLSCPIAFGIIFVGLISKFIFDFSAVLFLYSIAWALIFFYWFDGSEYQRSFWK